MEEIVSTWGWDKCQTVWNLFGMYGGVTGLHNVN